MFALSLRLSGWNEDTGDIISHQGKWGAEFVYIGGEGGKAFFREGVC